MKSSRVLVAWALLAALTGCGASHERNDEPRVGPSSMIYSPNGQPLNGGDLGRPTCRAAMALWLARIDLNHDGSLSREEFLRDAQAQFLAMDIDKNGYLVPEELERYRLPFREQAPIPAASRSTDDRDSSEASSRLIKRAHTATGRNNEDEGGSQIVEDPVMSADTNNDFRVTSAEFIAQAARKFDSLDTDHSGTLSVDEVENACTQKKH